MQDTGSRPAAPIGQILRFLAAGTVNTAFGYLVYALGILAGLGPELALAIAVCLGVIFNYFTFSRGVFDRGGRSFFFRFVAAYAIIYGLNVAVLHAILAQGLGPLVSQALALIPVVICTYVILKIFVFRR